MGGLFNKPYYLGSMKAPDFFPNSLSDLGQSDQVLYAFASLAKLCSSCSLRCLRAPGRHDLEIQFIKMYK